MNIDYKASQRVKCDNLNNVILSVLFPIHDINTRRAKLTFDAFTTVKSATMLIGGDVIVVDDGSPCKEAVRRILTEGGENTKVIFHDTCQGLVKSLNDAAKYATGELLTYCHSDCVVESNAIGISISAFEDKSTGLAVSSLWYPNGGLQQIGGWVGLGWRLSWNTCLKNEEQDVHWGDFWTVRSSLFKSCGGLPDEYGPGYWECVDLATSVRKLKYRVVGLSNSRVIHYKSRTFFSVYDESARNTIFERNRSIFAKRWTKDKDWIFTGLPADDIKLVWK